MVSGHKSKSQKMDLIYVRTQVKIAKYGNYVWWINLSYTVLTSTLVLGINYFVIITRPLHHAKLQHRSRWVRFLTIDAAILLSSNEFEHRECAIQWTYFASNTELFFVYLLKVSLNVHKIQHRRITLRLGASSMLLTVLN